MNRMETNWQRLEPIQKGTLEIPELPGVRIEALPVFHDKRGSLHEMYRVDEIPPDFKPVMACSSWTLPGVTRGPHEHVLQDDYFTFAGPSEFLVALWDARPGAAGAAKAWLIEVGERHPAHIYVPHGVVHAYRNIGTVPGLVVTVASELYGGKGRGGAVDEIRHEQNPTSPYRLPE